MDRLIEQPTGDANVLDGRHVLGRVHYHLAVYQHFTQTEDASVPTVRHVEGRLTPVDPLNFPALHRRRAELILHLADGRRLMCHITSDEGRIRSTGYGLSAA